MPTSAEAGRRGPRRDAVVNREALLAAAAAELSASADASLDTIAQAAGLSRRAVYGHFATRDELVLALIERGAERLNRAAASVDHENPVIAIALLSARLWDAVEHVRLLAAMAVREPYVHGVATALAPVRARLCGLVGRGAALGAVRRDIPERMLTRLVEQAALAVLVETAADLDRTGTDADATAADGHGHRGDTGDDDRGGRPSVEPRRLIMLAVLGTVGLSWREAGALIDAAPELAPIPARDASSDAEARRP